ncbi:hypothetical protein [Kribbella turkmenica]|uniref:hypothetical protein n=1 Tax=Kribbella turkmenica TaxID=2530375 RepID=UPI001F2BFF09|nr:hypothetical protein [Kribbella turkmenica]
MTLPRQLTNRLPSTDATRSRAAIGPIGGFEIDQQEERLIDLVADGDLPSTKLRERLQKLAIERIQLEQDRQSNESIIKQAIALLSAVLHLLEDPQGMYTRASDLTRRRINDAFFEALYIGREFVDHAVLNPLFADVISANARHHQDSEAAALGTQKVGRPALASETTDRNTLSDVLVTTGDLDSVPGSRTTVMVELRGFEPLTSSMPWIPG